jgi:tagatose 6-phosphate kinase
MILCIGTTPAAQRVMLFRKVALNDVNRAIETLDGAAGKSINVAKVLKSFGERPLATGFLGGDRGDELAGMLRAREIEMDFVKVAVRTRQCITVIDESAGTQTELVEESRPVPQADYATLTRIIVARISGCRAVIMSGTISPGGPVEFYGHCTRLAREAGAMSVVDAKGALLENALGACPALVKPNRSELGATVGRELSEPSAVMLAMRQVCERGAERVVVTAGNEPTLAFDGKKLWEIVPPRIACINPIGSGDAFTAGLVWRLLRGEELGEACRWATAAGAANALTAMPGEVNLQDVERLAGEIRARQL